MIKITSTTGNKSTWKAPPYAVLDTLLELILMASILGTLHQLILKY